MLTNPSRILQLCYLSNCSLRMWEIWNAPTPVWRKHTARRGDLNFPRHPCIGCTNLGLLSVVFEDSPMLGFCLQGHTMWRFFPLEDILYSKSLSATTFISLRRVANKVVDNQSLGCNFRIELFPKSAHLLCLKSRCEKIVELECTDPKCFPIVLEAPNLDSSSNLDAICWLK